MTDIGRDRILAAARDAVAGSYRRAVASALSTLLGELGDRLRALAMFKTQPVGPINWQASKDDQLVAIAHLCETGAALINGAADLLQNGNVYAASALNRQLVEVEYLAWAFANDPDEATTWQVSSKEERLKRWQPRHLRDRSGGKFRGSDYAEHCEIGGHPTPDGMTNLLHGDRETMSGVIAYESAHHGSSVWDYLLLATAQVLMEREFDPAALIDGEAAQKFVALKDEWDGQDDLGDAWRVR